MHVTLTTPIKIFENLFKTNEYCKNLVLIIKKNMCNS